MILLSHFPAVGVSNTYIVNSDNGGDAFLVDPGRFDTTLLELIENRDFYIRSVLVTHAHDNHINGLKTLKKIYDADIYYAEKSLLGFDCIPLKNGDRFEVSGFEVQALEISGHSPDSRVFKLEHLLFTGDILSAGRIGTSPTSWGRANLASDVRTHLLCLNDETLILPGHGPPTTIGTERNLNPDLLEEED